MDLEKPIDSEPGTTAKDKVSINPETWGKKVKEICTSRWGVETERAGIKIDLLCTEFKKYLETPDEKYGEDLVRKRDEKQEEGPKKKQKEKKKREKKKKKLGKDKEKKRANQQKEEQKEEREKTPREKREEKIMPLFLKLVGRYIGSPKISAWEEILFINEKSREKIDQHRKSLLACPVVATPAQEE